MTARLGAIVAESLTSDCRPVVIRRERIGCWRRTHWLGKHPELVQGVAIAATSRLIVGKSLLLGQFATFLESIASGSCNPTDPSRGTTDGNRGRGKIGDRARVSGVAPP